MKDVTDQFSVRIVGYGLEKPESLLANPLNWRVHPDEQRDLLTHVLKKYGIVQNVVVNKRTQHVIDGHLRVKIAMQQGIPELPVTYIDVDEQDEKAILAAFDSTGAMAVCDKDMFNILLADIRTFDPDLSTGLESIDLTGLATGGGSPHEDEPGDDDVDTFDVVVSFRSAGKQSTFLREMKRRGIRCRTVRQ